MHLHTIKLSEIDKTESILCHITKFTGSYGALFMEDMFESDHRKESLQMNRPILCRGLARWLEQRHILLQIEMWQIRKSHLSAGSNQ